MGAKNKAKKFRGSRTCGGGTHKNRRGAGNRGGRGHAGGCKHHFLKELLLGRGYGKYGFVRPQNMLSDPIIVDVGDLDEAADQLVERKDAKAVSYTHLRAHETPEHLVCRLLLEKK